LTCASSAAICSATTPPSILGPLEHLATLLETHPERSPDLDERDPTQLRAVVPALPAPVDRGVMSPRSS
jgi:hypothetical protein